MVWENTPCLTLHDRSDGAFHLPYAIPFEDLEITPDEVADSRRHQFFAYCRPHHPQDFLPTWITQADVDDAVAVGLLMSGTVESDDILENSTRWQDCWFRINADADRRPISFAMANEGVDWDVTSVPSGAYTLYGYNYEPVFNVWYLRPGVLKLHDGDPHAVGPAGAITTGELTPYRDDEVMIEGCAHALPGSTFTSYWALVPLPDVEPDWVVDQADQELPGEDFAFAFTPPEPTWGQSTMLRVDLEDPEGRTYTIYQADNMLVINSDNPDSCDHGGSFIGSPCGESSGSGESTAGTSDATTASGTTTAAETSTADSAQDGPGGSGDDGSTSSCSCSEDRPGNATPWLLVVLAPLSRRRRRAG